jgi:hypothetical protein
MSATALKEDLIVAALGGHEVIVFPIWSAGRITKLRVAPAH